MATTTTGITNFSTLVHDLVRTRSEAILAALYPHADPRNCETGTLVKGTNQIRFPAIAQIAASTTTIAEGTAPTATALAFDSDYIAVGQRAWSVELTDLAMSDAPVDLLVEASTRLADQVANSIDIIVRDVLAAGTSVKFSGSATVRSAIVSTDVMSGLFVKKISAGLMKLNVPRFSDGYYRAIIRPEQAFDLMADTATGGWIDAIKYSGNLPILAQELGSFGGVRFMVTTNASYWATAGASSANVAGGIFFGPEAYAVGDLSTVHSYYVPAGGDHSDPAAQKAIVAAKARVGACLLDANGARYLRAETGCTTV